MKTLQFNQEELDLIRSTMSKLHKSLLESIDPHTEHGTRETEAANNADTCLNIIDKIKQYNRI